jgi:hypothetical protein
MGVHVVRAFVRLRNRLGSNKVLAQKLDELESKYKHHDKAIAAMLSAIRQLMRPPPSKRRSIHARPAWRSIAAHTMSARDWRHERDGTLNRRTPLPEWIHIPDVELVQHLHPARTQKGPRGHDQEGRDSASPKPDREGADDEDTDRIAGHDKHGQLQLSTPDCEDTASQVRLAVRVREGQYLRIRFDLAAGFDTASP